MFKSTKIRTEHSSKLPLLPLEKRCGIRYICGGIRQTDAVDCVRHRDPFSSESDGNRSEANHSAGDVLQTLTWQVKPSI